MNLKKMKARQEQKNRSGTTQRDIYSDLTAGDLTRTHIMIIGALTRRESSLKHQRHPITLT